MNEIWKDIDCFNIKKMYKISNTGKIINNRGKNISLILSNGYLTACLQLNNNSRKTFYVHILVAMTFIEKPNNDSNLQVNHKDLCRCNNYVHNLEWMTQQENIKHEFEHKDDKKNFDSITEKYTKNKGWKSGNKTYGENNGMSEWTGEIVHKLCHNVSIGMNYEQALIDVGLPVNDNNRYNLSHIIHGVRWKHISNQYNFDLKNKIKFELSDVNDVCKLKN